MAAAYPGRTTGEPAADKNHGAGTVARVHARTEETPLMHGQHRSRRPAALVVALSLLLALPMLATGGPAVAAPGGTAVASRPVAAPQSDLLAALAGLLARLFPAPSPAGPGVQGALASRVTASTVKVSGVACGLRLQGSGFSPAPDTIVTNAHVVAGTSATTVLRPDGQTLPAQVQIFDPSRDLAVLAVPGLGQPALPLGSAVLGETDAVFGHPRGQVPIEISPARVIRRVTVDIGDIYGRPTTPRQIVVLNSDLEPGDSGAPLVNGAGQVVGVAFGTATLRPSTAFAMASEELAPLLAQPRRGPASTGPCIA
jgi:S1-C subfamily serine protease